VLPPRLLLLHDLEDERLIDAVLRVCAGIEAESDDGVAPGTGGKDVTDVLDGGFEVVFCSAAEVVVEAAAGGDGTRGEEGA